MRHLKGSSREHRFKVLTLVATLSAATLLASACFDSNGAPSAPPGEAGNETGVSTGNPGETPGSGTGTATTAPGGEASEGPEPGEPTALEFEEIARGTDPVDQRFTPKVILARSPDEGEAAANASPAPGAASYLRDWDEYEENALVAVLGGSQPDQTHRVVLRAINVIKGGALLLASGRIVRGQNPGAQVISLPWVVLTVPASAADTVQRCTLSLEGASPFTTACG